jgi:glycosyltransferase involved in cell wall biosynthesis
MISAARQNAEALSAENLSAETLSVVMITKNAERLLDPVLAQASKIASEIIIVDSGSTDKTLEIAKKYTQKITEVSDWPGFGIQKQRAVEAASGDWILVLDADEIIDQVLLDSLSRIIKTAPEETCDAYELKRPLVFGGKVLRRSVSFWTLRLFKKGRGKFTDQKVHEKLVIESHAGTPPKIGRVQQGELLHYSYGSVGDWLARMQKYTDLFVEECLAKNASDASREQSSKQSSVGFAVLSAFFVFIKVYVFKGAFLEGRMGFVISVNWAIGNYIKYLKLALREDFLREEARQIKALKIKEAP